MCEIKTIGDYHDYSNHSLRKTHLIQSSYHTNRDKCNQHKPMIKLPTASDLNTLRSETKWPTFADSIFKCFFLNENRILIQIPLKVVVLLI